MNIGLYENFADSFILTIEDNWVDVHIQDAIVVIPEVIFNSKWKSLYMPSVIAHFRTIKRKLNFSNEEVINTV